MDGYMKTNVEKFIHELQFEKKRSENTCVSYRRDLNKFIMYCQIQGEATLEKCSTVFMQNYIFYLEKENMSSASIARHMSALKAFFSYLIRKGMLDNNPMDNLQKPVVERKLPTVLNEFQIEQLLNAPDCSTEKGCRDKAMLELLYATGIRVTELIMLQLEDINLEYTYVQCGAKGKRRVVPFGKYAKEALESYLKEARNYMTKTECPYLFVSCNGDKMSRQGFWKNLKKYAQIAQIDVEITPNTLRHSFAMHLIENGANLYAVQEMMGHVDMSSTQVYAEMSKRKIREVYHNAHPRN